MSAAALESPRAAAATLETVVRVCVPEDAAAWDHFVESHPGASVYHLWAWRGIFTDVFSHECRYLAAWRGGVIVGILPVVVFRTWLFGRFAVSLPFVNYGGAVADDAGVREALVAAATADALGAGCSHLELRHTRQWFPELAPKRHKVAMLLSLRSSEQDQWDGLDRKVRNQIRKAQKAGLSAAVGGLELAPEFYGVFARNMRDLGTPVYSRDLFTQVLARLPDRARVIVVRRGAVAVAAGLTLAWRDRVELPWASSLREYLPLCPNMLLDRTAISAAAAMGASVFDFGRSTSDEGTFHFKQQWGAKPHPMCWEYALAPGRLLPDQSPKNAKFGALISVWKRVPVRVANAVGPSVVRQIP